MDYRMDDGMLRMKLRAATAGYILRKWSVDCSPDHSLRGHEFRLWLKDHLGDVRRQERDPCACQQRLESEVD
jgi:hypothetical protein